MFLNVFHSLIVICGLLGLQQVSAFADSSALGVAPCNGKSYQQWKHHADNTIRDADDGKCLDVSAYGTSAGSVIWLYTCHTSDNKPSDQNQEFTFNSKTGSVVEIMSGLCIGISPVTNGTVLATCGTASSTWTWNAQGNLVSSASGMCLSVLGNYPAPCENPLNMNQPFCDVSLPIDERVDNLISLIPQAASIGLFANGASGVEAIQLPPYQWWSEALHGVANSPGVTFTGNMSAATSFPQVCMTGGTFNKELFSKIGDTVGKEARAMNNYGRAGLTFWAPNINIFRDPRWGRGQETPGEDPFLTSTYAHRFVRSMQNNSLDPSRLRVSSCCKHFTAYDVEDWGGQQRYYFDAIVNNEDMYNTFMVPFEACYHQNGGAGSGMMCSYNAVNGVPMCANGPLITGDARVKWGFDGYVTSDCDAAANVYNAHHYTATPEEAVMDTLNAGMDIDCGGFLEQYLPTALQNGNVTSKMLQQAMKHQFRVMMRLGYFDPVSVQPFKMYNATDVNTPEAQELALKVAQEGVVMLIRNESVLPLNNKTIRNIAVFGPNANNPGVQLGNYNGDPPYVITVTEGLSNYANVQYLRACGVSDTNVSDFSEACAMAGEADAVVLVMGIDQSIESEGHDRYHIRFPGVQLLFIHTIADCAKQPVTVVVMSGGSLDYTELKHNPKIGGLLWVGYPGQSGGQAIADVIFGTVSPSGRLPHTVYPSDYVDIVSMLDMQMESNVSTGNPGRTYRFFTGTPVFPFGTGLSYSTFSVVPVNTSREGDILSFPSIDTSRVDLAHALPTATSIGSLSVNITNTGSVPSAFSALMYVISVPARRNVGGNLADFEKVFLNPGESKVVDLQAFLHAFLNHPSGQRQIAKGTYEWTVAGATGTIFVQ